MSHLLRDIISFSWWCNTVQWSEDFWTKAPNQKSFVVLTLSSPLIELRTDEVPPTFVLLMSFVEKKWVSLVIWVTGNFSSSTKSGWRLLLLPYLYMKEVSTEGWRNIQVGFREQCCSAIFGVSRIIRSEEGIRNWRTWKTNHFSSQLDRDWLISVEKPLEWNWNIYLFSCGPIRFGIPGHVNSVYHSKYNIATCCPCSPAPACLCFDWILMLAL